MLCIGVSVYAGVLPSPDRGTVVEDFRLWGQVIHGYPDWGYDDPIWHDWDSFTIQYHGNNVAVDKGPGCSFYQGLSNTDKAKTYWEDVTNYVALTGYSQWDNKTEGVTAARVSRYSGFYQIRVYDPDYDDYWACCGANIAKVKISRQYTGIPYLYSYTRTLISAGGGPNCP